MRDNCHLCPVLVTLLSLNPLWSVGVNPSVLASQQCLADRLTVYRVVLNTFWSRQKFPKHFPEWRPPAHWSKLVGRSHNESFFLFRVDHRVSEGVRIFAETGASDVLDELSQGEGGIYDEFNAPPISKGVGRTEAEFFVDGNHSHVSLMARIVPSPDWFVGLSSYNLCQKGRWVNSVTVEVDPLDAGTDNGLTFTSPNWPTVPRGEVSRITPRSPYHPASSFFYSDRERLPSIAAFQFFKVKEYELSEVFHHPQVHLELDISTNEVLQSGDIIRPPSSDTYTPSLKTPNNAIDYFPFPPNDNQLYKDKKKKLKKFRPPRDCQVSDWSTWSPCSSKTCGLGEMTRMRNVVAHARRGGRPCPPLKEASWCGSARNCARSYFNWGG